MQKTKDNTKAKLLSIIIPVYKVEQYLNKCVDSVLHALSGQEESYEMILVDDGSPDGCGAICDAYSKKASVHPHNPQRKRWSI